MDGCFDSTILALSEYVTRNPVFKGFKVDAVSSTLVLDEGLDVSPLGITSCKSLLLTFRGPGKIHFNKTFLSIVPIYPDQA
jgi:hypothetical protein